jgi:hypothetical protein
MASALQHSRTRYPGLVNSLLAPPIIPPDRLVFHTIWSFSAYGGYNGPAIAKSGDQLWIDFGDGTIDRLSGSNNHSYADSTTKLVQIWPSDGWSGATTFYTNWSHCVGNLPDASFVTNLTDYICDNNQFSGTIPDFSMLTALKFFHIENNSSLSGTLPDFSSCTALQEFYAHGNALDSYTAGSFSVQSALSQLWISNNSLTVTAVDGILSNLVTSLSLPGRATCEVHLDDGSNAPPSSLDDYNTLTSAGWTVYVN